jgi:5-methyltetrahydropteroyltriglutamate--homocysteine methyltransferase
VDALEEAGCRHIQVNDPMIVHNKDDIGAAAAALERLLDGVQAETGVYTWFGDATGILERLLELPVDVIGLDFVAGRGNWDALRGVEFGKKLGLGIVDGRNTRLEDAATVAEAIRRAGEHVPAERTYVNPSCSLEYVPREVAFEKLKVLAEGARLGAGAAV